MTCRQRGSPTATLGTSRISSHSSLHHTALHWTAPHWTALHWTAPHCTAPYCTVPHRTALHGSHQVTDCTQCYVSELLCSGLATQWSVLAVDVVKLQSRVHSAVTQCSSCALHRGSCSLPQKTPSHLTDRQTAHSSVHTVLTVARCQWKVNTHQMWRTARCTSWHFTPNAITSLAVCCTAILIPP